MVGVTGLETEATPADRSSWYNVSRSSTKKATWAVPGLAVRAVHGFPSHVAVLQKLQEGARTRHLEDGGVKVDVGVPDELADVGRPRVPAEHLFEAEDVPVKSDGAIERLHL